MSVAGLVAGWAVLGWLVGALAARFTCRLLERDAPEAACPASIRGLGPLGTDPLLQGLIALAWAVLAVAHGPGLPLLVYSLSALALALVLVIDARTRFVYDVVVYPAIAAAAVLTPLASGQPFWSGLAGAAVGAALLLLLQRLGRRLYSGQEAIASGDISIAALVGAASGLSWVLPALLLGVILGGVIAAGIAVARRSTAGTMAYGPGLCLGALLVLTRVS